MSSDLNATQLLISTVQWMLVKAHIQGTNKMSAIEMRLPDSKRGS